MRLQPTTFTRYQKYNFPMTPHVRPLIGLSICHNILKRHGSYTSNAPIGALVINRACDLDGPIQPPTQPSEIISFGDVRFVTWNL